MHRCKWGGGWKDRALRGAYPLGHASGRLTSKPHPHQGGTGFGEFPPPPGRTPVLGQSFLPEHDTPNGPLAAMISTRLWQTRFGGDLMIAGQAATLAGMPYTVVGVLPAGFQFPFSDTDVWVTRPSAWSMIPPQSQPRLIAPILGIFGCLKLQVSGDQAMAELAVISRQYAVAHPAMLDVKPNLTDRVTLKDQVVRSVRSTL